jgi:hypothetical protein
MNEGNVTFNFKFDIGTVANRHAEAPAKKKERKRNVLWQQDEKQNCLSKENYKAGNVSVIIKEAGLCAVKLVSEQSALYCVSYALPFPFLRFLPFRSFVCSISHLSTASSHLLT